MKIFWLARAKSDRQHQAAHIVQDSPRAALAQIDRLMARVASLADHPEQGRGGRKSGTRELVVTGTPFVVYRLRSSLTRVEIIRVLHGKQKWPV